ncbi:MAG: ribonuclease Y [Candidatus Gracilibacteria bacterium]|nr:ribonuclease Y [Candidatus Gracilibacteria bacterium]
MYLFIALVLGLAFGGAITFVVQKIIEEKNIKSGASKSENILKEAQTKREELIREAEKKRDEILNNAKNESNQTLNNAKNESNEILKKSEKLEERLLEKEEKLEKKLEEIESKQQNILSKEQALEEDKKKIIEKNNELANKLSEISKLTESEARDLFLKQISDKYSDDGISVIENARKKVEERKTEMAREILIKSIQQYAGDVTNEVTTTVITLPNDEIKGKLIGKEGRNIVAFEKATGVALIIDDTPDTVFISAFDLFRRYIAKKSLEKLLEDGRIQPARIEEVVEKTTDESQILLRDLGQQAADELGITDIPSDLLPIIGKLRFRTSYGQNILKHSIEVAFVAESLAQDLKLDANLIKKGGLLHDIGKALDHDIEGTHPEIGGKLARKYGMNEKVIDMIENHHGEHFSISIEALVVQIADAISSVRPGARRENIEQYIKRVQEMEALVQSFTGVSKAYAISAGREVRVIVDADVLNDMEAVSLAREIADAIKNNLNYPGEVKVNLMREKRVIEYAK